ncbi:MAG: DUF393 domain-containing protein [Candidatus Nanopelagicales bacterium]|nr:DUF393 domain-containing protein [Candidatus Nanopelagicales bacterium]
MPTLIFDGECGFCRRRATWLRDHARQDLQIIAWQVADLESMGVTANQCQQRVQWVDGDEHASGGAAIAKCLQACGQPWRSAGIVMQWPVIRSLAEVGYRIVAANRGRIRI